MRPLHLIFFAAAVGSCGFAVSDAHAQAATSPPAEVHLGALRGRSAPVRIETKPSLDLGGIRDDLAAELDARLPYLVARPLSDGRWVVVDWSSVKLFDARGRFIRRMGRAGDGPGEFRQVRDVCIAPGDTIVAVSLTDRRIVVFDSAGKHVRTRTIPGDVRAQPCLADGSLLLRTSVRTEHPGEGGSMRRYTLAALHWREAEARPLDIVVAQSLDRTIPDVSSTVTNGWDIIVGSGDRPTFDRYDASGRLLGRVRWEAGPHSITEATRSEALQRGFPGSPVRRDHLPYYSALHVDAMGLVWVQEYTLPWMSSARYSLFTPDGRYLGEINVPQPGATRTDIVWIGRDRLLLAWRDGDGSPHLTLHAVER